MTLDYDFHLLKHFYPAQASATMWKKVKSWIRRLNRNNAELLEEIFGPDQEIADEEWDQPDAVKDFVPAMSGPATKPEVAGHTLRQETGVDLTEIVICKISECGGEALAAAKQAETDGRTVIYE